MNQIQIKSIRISDKKQAIYRKVILMLLMLGFGLFGNQTFAQTGDIRVGGGLGYGSEIAHLGINLNGEYFFLDNVSGQLSMNFFFPRTYTNQRPYLQANVWEVNFNGVYYFDVASDFRPYGMGGLNFTSIRWQSDDEDWPFDQDWEDSETKVGLNIGIGAEYDTGNAIIPFGQAKYVISDYDQLVMTFGVKVLIGSY